MLIAGFVVLATLVVGLAYWAWREQAASMRSQAERSVEAIGSLKAAEISAWVQERLGDAEIISGNHLLSAAVLDMAADRDRVANAARVRSYLAELRQTYEYVDVTLTAPDGSVLLRVPAQASHSVGARTRALVAEAQRTGRVVTSDLYRDDGGSPHLDIVAPVLTGVSGAAPVADVILHVDPATFLYPYIQEWPLRSDSAETLLVQRRGDRVVYLNELRFHEGSALRLSAPASGTELPAALAVQGRRGIVEGADYRGVPVIAAIAPVPGTDWFVVSKIDRDEVLGPIVRRGWLTAGFTLLVVGLAAVGTLLLWRLRESQTTAAIRESEARYRALVEHAPMAVFVNRDDRVVLANEACLHLFGATSPDELLGKSPFELFHPDCHEGIRERIRTLRDLGEEVPLVEERIVRLDGEPVDVEVAAAPFADQGVNAIHVVLIDITERKSTDAQLRETRDYLENLIGYANAPVIVWDPDLRITRFNHAFEDLTHRSAGEVVGRHIELLFPDDERRAEALARVTSATAGERWRVVEIPIVRADGQVRIVLWNSATVYASDGATPVATIAQGQDITDRVAAERELRDSEDKFRYFFERSVVAMSLTQPDGGLRVNDAFCRMLGYAREELDSRTWQTISHPDDMADTRRPRRSADCRERWIDVRFVKRYLHKDGAVIWGDVATSLRRDESGAPQYFMTAVVDITERRRATDELREREERLRFLVDQTPTVNWTLDDGAQASHCPEARG